MVDLSLTFYSGGIRHVYLPFLSRNFGPLVSIYPLNLNNPTSQRFKYLLDNNVLIPDIRQRPRRSHDGAWKIQVVSYFRFVCLCVCLSVMVLQKKFYQYLSRMKSYRVEILNLS